MIKLSKYVQIFFTSFLVFILLNSYLVLALEFDYSGSIIFEDQVYRSAFASGYGTSVNFLDPISNDVTMPTVLGVDSTSNNWVETSWNYYADGFGASITDEAGIFTGVWATAEVSHGKIGETQSNQYVYDAVSADSRCTFEFAMVPNSPEDSNLLPSVFDVPTNIGVKIILQAQGSEIEDMGNAQAIFYLEHISTTGKLSTVRYLEFTRRADETGEEAVTFPKDPLNTNWPGSYTVHSDGEQIGILFNEVPLKGNGRYRIRMYVHAGAYSVFEANDTLSESKAGAYMDPFFEINPDFEFIDNIKMAVSSELLDNSTNDQSKIDLELEQDGRIVTKILENGGNVKVFAPLLNDGLDETKFLWSSTSSGILDIDGELFDNQFIFNYLFKF